MRPATAALETALRAYYRAEQEHSAEQGRAQVAARASERKLRAAARALVMQMLIITTAFDRESRF